MEILTGFFASIAGSLPGYSLSGLVFVYGNMGIMLSLTFGAIILLRPITNRLIAPRWRVWIWFVGWYCGFLIQLYSWVGKISFLPISFRSLVIPRASDYGGLNDGVPQFLPEAIKAGDYTIAFPGGAELPVHISGALLGFLGVLWLVMFIGGLVWGHRREKELKAIGRKGVKMDEEQRAKFGIDRKNVVVRLCKDLPTSFVRFGYDDHFGDGTRFVICIQDGLPEERMRLVLLHEMEHLNQFHAWWKNTITVVMYFFWWNPILWLAHRLTCRDMELACDEAVMAKLNEHDRREYARTLVELGAGKPMWGAMSCFGECDAALRVRRVVNWKPKTRWRDVTSALLTISMVLFFYCGSMDMARAQGHLAQMDWLGYASGAAFEQDLQATRGADIEVEEVWERIDAPGGDEHALLVRVQTGEWFVCYCLPDNEGSYRIASLGLGHEPGQDLAGYRGIRIPDDAFKALYG